MSRDEHQQREAAVSDAERLSAMAAEASGLRLLLRDSIQKAAPDIDFVMAAERRTAHGRDICAVEGEMGRQPDTVAEQGDERAEARRWNSELGGRVQRLEEESGLLRESSEGLKDQLARVEAGQQSEVTRLQEAMTAGGSRVREDLGNVERELAKMKEEIRAMMPKPDPSAQIVALAADGTVPPALKPAASPKPLSGPPPAPKQAKQFPPVMRKGEAFDVPNGIIAHLKRECRGNVHDRHIVNVTPESFEKETYAVNLLLAAKNAADLETSSEFRSAYRRNRSETVPHTRNNWVCCDFNERRIVPTHYTIPTNELGPGGHHMKSWLLATSADGKNWRDVDSKDNSQGLNGKWYTDTFMVAGAGEHRLIRLVNIGRNHFEDDQLRIFAWEIFGSLID
jgi:hypothetical protein